MAVVMVLAAIAVALVWRRFDEDLRLASERAATGSVLIATRCGPIEYQAAGRGIPLLVIHGSGGGHDQGMVFAGGLTRDGIRVIAVSRFGYLRTPAPADASRSAQADAHACLLDALGTRVDAMLEDILPVSARAAGLRSDTAMSKHLAPMALESIRVPTLIFSTRDDGYGTYAGAEYTASRIAGARFVGFEEGGRTWV